MGYPISKTQSQTQRNTTPVQQHQKYEYINPIIIIKPFKQQRLSSRFSEWGRGPQHLDFSSAWWTGHKFLFRQWKCDWISSYACHKCQEKSTTMLFLKTAGFDTANSLTELPILDICSTIHPACLLAKENNAKASMKRWKPLAKTINATKILIRHFNKLLKQTCNTNSCGEHQRLGKNGIYRFYGTYYLLHTLGWKNLLVSVLIKAYLDRDLARKKESWNCTMVSHSLTNTPC